MLQAIPVKADFWGGDLIYLARIFQNSIYQLEQLRSITNAGKEITNILREVNRGVNQARQFRVQYKQLSNAFKKLKPNYSLHSL